MKESYCVVDKEETPCKEPSGYKLTKNKRWQFFCHCTVCANKKVSFVKEEDVDPKKVIKSKN